MIIDKSYFVNARSLRESETGFLEISGLSEKSLRRNPVS